MQHFRVNDVPEDFLRNPTSKEGYVKCVSNLEGFRAKLVIETEPVNGLSLILSREELRMVPTPTPLHLKAPLLTAPIRNFCVRTEFPVKVAVKENRDYTPGGSEGKYIVSIYSILATHDFILPGKGGSVKRLRSEEERSRQGYDRDRGHYRCREYSPPRRRERSPRRDYVDRDPRHDYVERSPRHDYVERSPHRDYVDRAPRHEYVDRAPRHDYVERSPHRDYVDRAPRHDYVDRAPCHGYERDLLPGEYLPMRPYSEPVRQMPKKSNAELLDELCKIVNLYYAEKHASPHPMTTCAATLCSPKGEPRELTAPPMMGGQHPVMAPPMMGGQHPVMAPPMMGGPHPVSPPAIMRGGLHPMMSPPAMGLPGGFCFPPPPPQRPTDPRLRKK